MTGITEEEFCSCFPCLCCECKGVKHVKENNDPCPPADRTMKKICCPKTPNEKEVSWYCCEREPLCPDCCTCDVNDCPPPYKRGTFYIRHHESNIFADYLIMFSDIVVAHGGKTCCKEFIQQNGIQFPCNNITGEGYINVCIDPAVKDYIIRAAESMGFYSVEFDYGISDDKDCYCRAK